MLTKWIRASRSSPVGMGARHAPPVAPFRLLYNAHAAYVHRRARYAGVPDADVQDVAQRVFEELFKATGRGLDPSGPLRGWLRDVTYRTARDHLKLARNEREEVTTTGSIDLADIAPTPEEHMQAIDAQKLVDEVLDVLPREQRIVLAMSDIEEMPMSEIALILEIPEGTGYSRLRAARRNFAVAWSERRTSGHAAILPFALWEANDLLHAAKPTPDLPREAMEEGWRRLVSALGPSMASAAGGVAAAAAVSAAKSGAIFTAKQAAVGVIASMLLGAGLHALVDRVRPVDPPEPTAVTVVASRVVAPAVASTPVTTVAPVASVAHVASAAQRASGAPTASAAPTAHAAGGGDEKNELAALRTARDAIQRGEFDKARAALNEVRSPRFAGERDDLRRMVRAYQDGGP